MSIPFTFDAKGFMAAVDEARKKWNWTVTGMCEEAGVSRGSYLRALTKIAEGGGQCAIGLELVVRLGGTMDVDLNPFLVKQVHITVEE